MLEVGFRNQFLYLPVILPISVLPLYYSFFFLGTWSPKYRLHFPAFTSNEIFCISKLSLIEYKQIQGSPIPRYLPKKKLLLFFLFSPSWEWGTVTALTNLGVWLILWTWKDQVWVLFSQSGDQDKWRKKLWNKTELEKLRKWVEKIMVNLRSYGKVLKKKNVTKTPQMARHLDLKPTLPKTVCKSCNPKSLIVKVIYFRSGYEGNWTVKISKWTNLGHRQNEWESVSKEKDQRFWKGIIKELTWSGLWSVRDFGLSMPCVSRPSF